MDPISSFDYQTSEKIRISYEVAEPGTRIIAAFLDSMIQGAFQIFLIILLLPFLTHYAAADSGKPVMADILALLVIGVLLASVTLLYNFIFEWVWRGQTPGKKALRIRAVHDDGTLLVFRSVLLRNLFRIVDLLPFYGIIGIVVMFANRKRKRIGDYAAGTIVIREPKVTAPDASNFDDRFSLFTDAQARLLTDEELNLIQDFLQNYSELDIPAQSRIEGRLTQIIQTKTGIYKPAGVTDEQFIKAFYTHVRK